MHMHGIQGDAARWIRNRLTGMRQRVCINQFYINWAPVTSGIPQGSVLVPLLFLIYKNNLDTNIVSKMFKFSEDTKLYNRARNSDDIMELQEDINKLVECSNKWQMSFNMDKIMFCYTHRTQQRAKQLQHIQSTVAENRSTAGSWNHHHKGLKWQKQTERSSKTENKVLGFIARNFRYKNN